MAEADTDRKAQILSQIESLSRALGKAWSRELDDKLDQAFKDAETSGIGELEIKRAEFKAYDDPKRRQARFTDLIEEGLEDLTLNEAVKLRDEFGLEG